MNKNIKKAFCLLAACAFLLKGPRASAKVIEDRKERMNIASGVEHVKIDRFTDKGFIDIDVLKLDSSNPYSALIPLFAKEGVSKREILTRMVETSDAVAGINGDFFEVTKFPMALGSLVNDGSPILSTPEAAFSRNSFYINKEGKAGVGSLNNDIKVTINNQVFDVHALNKLSRPYKILTILDENWGPTSPGKNLGANNVELLIANGKVIDKRVGGNPFDILPGTIVLTQVGDSLNKFNVGDTVSIDYGSYKNLKFAIGGGNVLIKNGQIAEKLSNARAPRTAIGTDKNNKVIYLVTVDGRNNSSIGMGEKEFAEFLRSLGIVTALNLDGGGSTTMAIKYSGDSSVTLKNTPSDGKERPIVSGVGIKTSAPIEEASYLTVNPSDKNMFAGFSYPVDVKVFDKNHNRLPVDPAEIILSSDNGSFNGNNITVNKKGFGKITASYKGLSGSADVFFHSDLKEFSLDVDYLQVENDKTHIFETIYGLDDRGYKKKIPASMVTFEASSEIGIMEGNKFTAKAEGLGSGIITASYNGLKRFIPVSVSAEKISLESFANIDGKSFYQSMADKSLIAGSIATDEEGKNDLPSLALNYNFANHKDVQVAGINFDEKISLGSASGLGLWIKGDGKGAKLQGVFVDDNGKTISADIVSKISFEDWKYVEANIPKGLSGNIYLQRLEVSLKENKVIQSKIKFSDPRALIKPVLNFDLAKESSKLIDPSIYEIKEGNPTRLSIGSTNSGDISSYLQNRDQAFTYKDGRLNPVKSTFASENKNGYELKKLKNIALINLEANKNGLRSKNADQLIAFKNLMADDSVKNILITMNIDPENLSGSKEKEYFFEKIDQGVKAGKNIFIILPGSSTRVSLANGYRKVTLNPADPASLDIFITDTNMAYILKRF